VVGERSLVLVYSSLCSLFLIASPAIRSDIPSNIVNSLICGILNIYEISVTNSRVNPEIIMRWLALCGNVLRDLLLYVFAALAITVFLYYVPDYFVLEQLTAFFSSIILNLVGVRMHYSTTSNEAFVGGIQVIRECTGVQVISVMAGLILPIRNSSWLRKIKVLLVVSVILFVMNFLRIALEIWLVYYGILPWSLAHYPLSLVLGIAGVYTLVLVSDNIFPEFGDQIAYFYAHLTQPSTGSES